MKALELNDLPSTSDELVETYATLLQELFGYDLIVLRNYATARDQGLFDNGLLGEMIDDGILDVANFAEGPTGGIEITLELTALGFVTKATGIQKRIMAAASYFQRDPTLSAPKPAAPVAKPAVPAPSAAQAAPVAPLAPAAQAAPVAPLAPLTPGIVKPVSTGKEPVQMPSSVEPQPQASAPVAAVPFAPVSSQDSKDELLLSSEDEDRRDDSSTLSEGPHPFLMGTDRDETDTVDEAPAADATSNDGDDQSVEQLGGPGADIELPSFLRTPPGQ